MKLIDADLFLKEIRDKAQELSNQHWGDDERHLIGKGIQCMYVQTENIIKVNMEQSAEDCGGWIKCKVRFPEEGKEVLLQDYYGNREIGRFGHNKDYQEGFYIGDWFSTASNYLSWCELPDPYHEP